MIGKLKIEIKVNEQDFIEGLLNAKYSGTDNNRIMVMLAFYGLGSGWKVDKLIYYLNLLEIKRDY